MDVGLLVIRVVFGLLMAGHGAQKLFGWFGGSGLDGTGGFLDAMGFRPGRVFALLAGASEFGGGSLLALGLLGPLGPVLLIAVMVVAIVAVHAKNGLWVTANGIEVPLLFATVAVALAWTGYGGYSLDARWGLTASWEAVPPWTAATAGLLGGVLSLTVRRAPVVPPVSA